MQKVFVIVGFLVCVCSSASTNQGYFQVADLQIYPALEITIDLQNKPPGDHLTGFHELTNFVHAEIKVLNVNNAVAFFLVQVHAFLENITLSYGNALDTYSYTTGTNIGLIWKANLAQQAYFYLFRDYLKVNNLTVLISVSTYSKYDPVPGGCNLSFETEIAPYQKINQSDEIITVLSQPPSVFGEFCNRGDIVTDMYYLYLPEHNNSTNQYFTSIQKMISAENIVKYGTKVPAGLTVNRFKQMYNRYIGTGRVFAIVATHQGRSSAYVPAVSYGCNASVWDNDCSEPVSTQWKIVNALLFLCGLFICFGGHRFFTTGLFIVGYTFGVLFMLMMINIHPDFSKDGKDIFALFMGFFFAASWLLLWRRFGRPVIAVQLAFLLSGLLGTSILFYSELGDIYIFANNLTFWTCFAAVVIITQIPLLCLKSLHYIIALSLLGSYAFIVAINYYIGGNLPYILINTYRRITVPDFGFAVISPPYQTIDIWQTVLWVLIFTTGVYVQRKHSLGKPPFPPHRTRVPTPHVNENTPLLPEDPPPYSARAVIYA